MMMGSLNGSHGIHCFSLRNVCSVVNVCVCVGVLLLLLNVWLMWVYL